MNVAIIFLDVFAGDYVIGATRVMGGGVTLGHMSRPDCFLGLERLPLRGWRSQPIRTLG